MVMVPAYGQTMSVSALLQVKGSWEGKEGLKWPKHAEFEQIATSDFGRTVEMPSSEVSLQRFLKCSAYCGARRSHEFSLFLDFPILDAERRRQTQHSFDFFGAGVPMGTLILRPTK